MRKILTLNAARLALFSSSTGTTSCMSVNFSSSSFVVFMFSFCYHFLRSSLRTETADCIARIKLRNTERKNSSVVSQDVTLVNKLSHIVTRDGRKMIVCELCTVSFANTRKRPKSGAAIK